MHAYFDERKIENSYKTQKAVIESTQRLILKLRLWIV